MQRVRFVGNSDFYMTLRGRVDRYFEETGQPKTGTWPLFLKTAIIGAIFLGSYIYLVFYADTLWTSVCAALGLSLGMILTGFNLMHDGAHNAYCRYKWINWVMGATLDLLGGSNFLWRQKHNLLHHSYTNIDMLDRDLQTSGSMRLSPVQAWRPAFRFQHWYALPLYSLGTLMWNFRNDYSAFLTRRFGSIPLRAPTRAQTAFFFGAKAFYYGYALILPSFLHPVWQVVLAFIGIHLVLGTVLFLVFQMAHTTEGSMFFKPDGKTGDIIDTTWAIHEVEATADFATNNKLATWCMGGLNFHVEHHLFPKISHIHYPAIRPIVRQTCQEYGLVYRFYPRLWPAIKAHFRFLKQMGQPPDDRATQALAPLPSEARS